MHKAGVTVSNISNFGALAERALAELAATHELATAVVPYSAERASNKAIGSLDPSKLTYLSADQKALLVSLLRSFADQLVLAAEAAEAGETHITVTTQLNDASGTTPSFESAPGGGVQVRIPDPEVAYLVGDALQAVVKASVEHDVLLGRGILALQISIFELFVGDTAKITFRKNKAALRRSDHEFTLEQLEEFETIEEARESLINKRVDTLISGGIDEWTRWLERKDHNVQISSILPCWNQVREVVARRNLLVHRGGRVDSRYLSVAKRAVDDAGLPDVGSTLTASTDYLKSSADYLSSAAIAITLLLSTQLPAIQQRGRRPLACRPAVRTTAARSTGRCRLIDRPRKHHQRPKGAAAPSKGPLVAGRHGYRSRGQGPCCRS